MGQLSAGVTFLKNALGVLWQVTVAIAIFIYTLVKKVWLWCRLHIPLFEVIRQRHASNPATIFTDFALFILGVYLAFGVVGIVLVYPKKSETRFTEVLTILYPLPAGKVNNSVVWSHRFLQRLRFLNTFSAAAPADLTTKPPTEAELREKVMAGLIEDKVIYFEAQKRGVSVKKEELDAAYDAQAKQVENLDQKIHDLYGMSIGEFKEIIAERLLKEKVKSAVISRIRVRHILVSTNSAASEAKKQLAGGTDFAEVTKTFSQDSKTKDTGGDLGYWTKGELVSQINQLFEDTAFKLEVNAISDPVQTQFGYHIIQVTEKTGDNYQSYPEWYQATQKSYKIKEYLSF